MRKNILIIGDIYTEVQYFPTKKTNSVDDTAAGDIFRAVFVDTYLRAQNIQLAAERATQIASLSTKIKGVDKTLQEVNLT